MGILDFLKKKQAETVKLTQLNDWLNKKVEGKKIEQKIAASKRDINQIIKETIKNLEELEVAKLVNENIPIKEKQIMEGHRKTYIYRMKKFLDEISIPDDFSEIGHYNARFSEKLNSLAQETLKNYSVLKHFFNNEASRIAQGIKNLEAALTKLQLDIEREGVEVIKEAKLKLKQYNEDYERKAKLERDIEYHKQELEGLNRKKEKIEAKISDLKKGSEYSDFKEALEEKKKIETEILKQQTELIELFSDLTRPLKKHTHNTPHEKITDKYLADPAGALEEDTSLVMHEVLRKMQQEIDSLDLKDKQLDRAKELCEKLSREYLITKKEELLTLKEKNRELASKINRSVSALNISESESWIKSLDNKIAEWEKRIERTTKELQEINLNYLKQKVKEKVHEIDKSITFEDDA